MDNVNLKLKNSTVVSIVMLISLSLVSTKLIATPLPNNSEFHNRTLTTILHTNHTLQQNLPNSISGIKKNAKVGDFVMLKGRFVRKVDTNVLEFTDDGKQAVLVNFRDSKDMDFIRAQIEYEIWGKIIRNDKLTFVVAVSLSKTL
ncbi:MAG: hypothetical protein SPF26_02910 [Succinivibrio sp.]|nr:hypothetical protein [Succinivibrio sp.]